MDQFTVESVLNIIREFVPKGASISVADSEKYIYYQPSKQVDLRIKPGDLISENTATYQALSIRKKIGVQVESNVFGVPYYGLSVPIMNEGNPLGAVTAILPSKPMILPTSFLTIKIDDRWIPLPYGEIMYLEAQNRKTKIQSELVSGYHKMNLSELELILPSDSFIRVHRSYIVNINYIQEILPDFHSTFLLIMKDSSKIQVSQTYASQFRRALGF
ncbi:LytTR family DNA-binding domain-containing protein [Peribacillus muralis]|uniref:LytR family transcriptional regulator n=1 Tax=Peribacillus muralis TaxID=264697 RepID=A0A1B3XJ16_9BACI|nr:LytTR family DNA-binding domain-containing protein [Peribacillus muralis]AOH53193.1 LytR family transcriptional regulator [Peribacillus muralis]